MGSKWCIENEPFRKGSRVRLLKVWVVDRFDAVVEENCLLSVLPSLKLEDYQRLLLSVCSRRSLPTNLFRIRSNMIARNQLY